MGYGWIAESNEKPIEEPLRRLIDALTMKVFGPTLLTGKLDEVNQFREWAREEIGNIVQAAASNGVEHGVREIKREFIGEMVKQLERHGFEVVVKEAIKR